MLSFSSYTTSLMVRKRGWNCPSSEIERSFGVPRWFARRDWRIARRSQLLGGVEVTTCMLVPCNLLAQRVRPWSVLGSSGVRTGVFGSPLPVSSSCEYTKRRRSFVMVSRGWCRSRHTRWAAPSDSDLVSYSVENNHRAAAPHRNY